MEELIKRLERVIQTGAPDKDGQHPISAETVLEVVKGLSELGTNLAEVGTDCISRQAVIGALRTCYDTETITMDNGDEYINYGDAVGEIEQLPPIQPDIVRCKDCKHWIPYDWMFSEVWQSKNIADYPEEDIGCDCCDMAMKANDFCSRAERRTG